MYMTTENTFIFAHNIKFILLHKITNYKLFYALLCAYMLYYAVTIRTTPYWQRTLINTVSSAFTGTSGSTSTTAVFICESSHRVDTYNPLFSSISNLYQYGIALTFPLFLTTTTRSSHIFWFSENSSVVKQKHSIGSDMFLYFSLFKFISK